VEMRASFRQTAELTVKFFELLVLDPSSKPRRFPQLFGEAGADAITAAIENDPLKASQRELFQLEALRHSNCSRPGLCNGTPCD
jgi:hypothetical protein